MDLTTKDIFTFTLTGISLLIGSAGLLLGIYNTWRASDRDKVKLKVVPKCASLIGAPQPEMLAFDVTNLSTFPVTITEVGVLYHSSDQRGCIVRPIMIDGGSFPRKLEPRTAFSAYLELENLDPRFFLKIRCAYVSTACGVSVEGTSAAFNDLILRALESTLQEVET